MYYEKILIHNLVNDYVNALNNVIIYEYEFLWYPRFWNLLFHNKGNKDVGILIIQS